MKSASPSVLPTEHFGNPLTEAALRSLWRRSHRDRVLTVGRLTGFLLTRR